MIKTNRLLAIVFLGFICIVSSGCKKNKHSASCSDGIQNQGETGVDCGGPCSACVTERDKAVEDYNLNYLGSNVDDPGWTGNTATCDAGTVPQSTHDKVLQRINYFRRLVGLNDNTTWDVAKFPEFQQAALIMKANNSISHDPPSTWTCWSSSGASGAGSSNLAIGTHSSAAITLFIEDPGTGNEVVGHRRWILHSAKTQFSYGTTNTTMSLGVIGVAGGNQQIPPFIAYPSPGYFPQQLVFPRWSFSIPGAIFTSANVTMTGPNGDNVPLNIIARSHNLFGDNTLVWEPSSIITNSSNDINYTVNITGVSSAEKSDYNYTVTIIRP